MPTQMPMEHNRQRKAMKGKSDDADDECAARCCDGALEMAFSFLVVEELAP